VATVQAVDETGGEARTYMCDREVVVKTQRPHRVRPRTSLKKEAFILDQLAASITVPIPLVFGYGHEGDVEYLVMSRIPGIALETTPLSGPTRTAALEKVGATMRQIHEVDQTAMETSELIPGDRNAADLRIRLSVVFEQLIAGLTPDRRWPDEGEIRAMADQCLADLPADSRPVTLHSNPGAEHCFVDPATGRFTGLIDFGDAFRSHPALDLRSWVSPTDSWHVLAGYRSLGPLPPGFEQVWRTGIVITELRLATRGDRQPDDAVATIRDLLTGPPDRSSRR
jgi:aminoglycoside phosphotransferase (APT) family kinase protein